MAYLTISDSYSKVLKWENRIPSAVCKGKTENCSLVLPLFIKKRKSIFFAVDNIDWQINDYNAQNQFHGTVVKVNQNNYYALDVSMMHPITLQLEETESI